MSSFGFILPSCFSVCPVAAAPTTRKPNSSIHGASRRPSALLSVCWTMILNSGGHSLASPAPVGCSSASSFRIRPHACRVSPQQAEDEVSALPGGGVDVPLRPRVWLQVLRQLRLQRPERQEEDSGRRSPLQTQAPANLRVQIYLMKQTH